ncbi:MAG: DUF1501 domain-containing protein, partial [Rubrivivax sp.]|nr:DUF1501 domain-containing protein [Rubrivivax sp.]
MAALGGAAPLAANLSLLTAAAAQGAGDYKALVCVFLDGGNDAFNTVLATDPDSWASYQSVRSHSGGSIAQLPVGTHADRRAGAGSPESLGGVLPIAPTRTQGRSFALHPV